MTWPTKPKGRDEHAWYREIEKTITLTVISADPDDRDCPNCGRPGVVFQCQVYPSRQIVALCKECAIDHAGGTEKLWVRTEEYFRKKWLRNAKDPELSRRRKQVVRERLTGAGGVS